MTAFMDDDTDHAVETPCQQDPDTWFPSLGQNPRLARTLCQACPYQDPCLEAALDLEGNKLNNMRHGVWGGMTPQERADEAMLRRAEKARTTRAAA